MKQVNNSHYKELRIADFGYHASLFKAFFETNFDALLSRQTPTFSAEHQDSIHNGLFMPVFIVYEAFVQFCLFAAIELALLTEISRNTGNQLPS